MFRRRASVSSHNTLVIGGSRGAHGLTHIKINDLVLSENGLLGTWSAGKLLFQIGDNPAHAAYFVKMNFMMEGVLKRPEGNMNHDLS